MNEHGKALGLFVNTSRSLREATEAISDHGAFAVESVLHGRHVQELSTLASSHAKLPPPFFSQKE